MALAAVAAGFGLAGPSTASAIDVCFEDPSLNVTLPDGRQAVVYVTEYTYAGHQQELVDSHISYQSPVVTVTVPNENGESPFPVYVVVSTGPAATGTILSGALGQSGSPINLTLGRSESDDD